MRLEKFWRTWSRSCEVAPGTLRVTHGNSLRDQVNLGGKDFLPMARWSTDQLIHLLGIVEHIDMKIA